MPPSAVQNSANTDTITPSKSSFFEVLFYAVPRFSDLLRRMTDIKTTGMAKGLNMTPSTGLWLTLALVGVIISANSYFVSIQTWFPDAQGQIATVVPLGREDVLFKPMALVPPVLQWLAFVVNLGTDFVGLILPDSLQVPDWSPATRATIYNNPTYALAWWFGGVVSILVSSTQGLLTRCVPLGKQREYATRLNSIARIELNPKAIAPAKRAVSKYNSWGTTAVWLMCLVAVCGWGWELFLADGALEGSTFDSKAWWIYTLSSAFLAEVAWFIADRSGKEI